MARVQIKGSGITAQLFIDGNPIGGVVAYSIDHSAYDVPRMTMSVLIHNGVDVELNNVEIETIEKCPTDGLNAETIESKPRPYFSDAKGESNG